MRRQTAVVGVAAAAVLAVIQGPRLQAQGWSVIERTDPLDDTRLVFVVEDAHSNTGGSRVSLVVRCDLGAVDRLFGPLRVFIDWGEYLGDGISRTAVRFPPADAEDELLMISEGGTAGFVGRPSFYLERLMAGTESGSTFVARTTPYNSNPVTAVWELADAGPALAKVAEPCEPYRRH